MGEISSRLNGLASLSGRIFIVALLVSVTLLGATSVEMDRLEKQNALRSLTASQLSEISQAARDVDRAARRFQEYLNARYAGRESLPHALRQIQSDFRFAAKANQSDRTQMRQGEMPHTADSSVALKAITALLSYNTGSGDAFFDGEPSLRTAPLSHGSFDVAERVDELTIIDLSRYLWLASVDVSKLYVDGIDPSARANELVNNWNRIAGSAVGKTARLEAATAWEHMRNLRNSPQKYGLTLDAKGQTTLAEIFDEYERLRAIQTQDRLETLVNAQVNPGFGVAINLLKAVSISPYFVAVMLLVMIALYTGIVGVVKKVGHGSQISLSLPFVRPQELTAREGMFASIAQIVLILLPASLVTWAVIWVSKESEAAVGYSCAGLLVLWASTIFLIVYVFRVQHILRLLDGAHYEWHKPL